MNKLMMKIKFIIFIISISAGILDNPLFSQNLVESPYLTFNRGQLWQSVYFGKIGPNFSNWGRKGIGLDWPGWDDSWITEYIGGVASHLASGGFWVGCKKSKDSVYAVEDWSIYAGTVTADAGGKYIIKEHRHLFKNGENFWLKSDPDKGEEVIKTVWELNKNYTNVDDREHQLPLRVTRVAHQWNGSKRDENYLIYEYTFKNISAEIKQDTAYAKKVSDTLFGFYALLSYAMHVNSRSWSVLFPSLTPGARNTWYFYDPSRRMIYCRAGDYKETPEDETGGKTNSLGLIVGGKPQGEWLAPGYAGVRVLYSTPDTIAKQPTTIRQWGWSAANNSIDQSGPFNGIPATNDKKYEVLEDIRKAYAYLNNSADNVYMQKSRLWSMMSLGPWTILPGDSVVIVIAEMVDGVDYKVAVDPTTTASKIGTDGFKAFSATADKAKFTYDNKMRHPNPPAAPKFKVDFYKEKQKFVANQITFGIEAESLKDPDDNTADLSGYKIYRSSFLPIGPWDSIVTIKKGDPNFYNSSEQKYVFVDSNVQIGTNYYYALTAFDTGKASWPRNLSARFTETNSNRVPPLESSIFANRTVFPFKATLPPTENLNDVIVVPNPFIIGEGYSQPGAGDEIQFINLPNPCTVRIYTIRGDLVKTIEVPENSGAIANWNQVTDFGQYVESGVYIYHVDAPGKGTIKGKFAIIR